MSTSLEVIFTAVVAIATLAYAGLTVVIVRETIRLRQAQTEPEVVLYLQPNERSPHIIEIVIRNVGSGTAYGLTWSFDTSSPLITDRDVGLDRMRFFRGVRYFAPNQEYRSFFAVSTDLLREPLPPPLQMDLTFENRDHKRHHRSFVIDVHELSGRSWVGDPPTVEMAKALTKLQKDVERLLSGSRRPRVDVFDSRDREDERRQRDEQFRQLQTPPQEQASPTEGSPPPE